MRIRAPHTEKYGTFTFFSHLFQFSVLTKIKGQQTIVAQKHSATGENGAQHPAMDV
jgi:hypothetical protein